MEQGRAASQSRLLQEQGSGRQRPSQVGGKVQGRTPLTVGVLVLSVVLRSRKTLAMGVQGPGPTAEKSNLSPRVRADELNVSPHPPKDKAALHLP